MKPKRPSAIPATPEELSERLWRAAMKDRTTGKPYKVSERFVVGEVIAHPKFGLGVVRAVTDKIEVQFKDAPRTLIHGKR